MALLDNRHPVEDTPLREVATRVAIPLVALLALFVVSLFSLDAHRATRATLIGLGFLAGFSTLVLLMRFEMGRRRFWIAGALVAFAALLVALV